MPLPLTDPCRYACSTRWPTLAPPMRLLEGRPTLCHSCIARFVYPLMLIPVQVGAMWFSRRATLETILVRMRGLLPPHFETTSPVLCAVGLAYSWYSTAPDAPPAKGHMVGLMCAGSRADTCKFAHQCWPTCVLTVAELGRGFPYQTRRFLRSTW